MDCLISHKNDADLNKGCRAAIEHFQIISLKSYHFTTKFKEACRPHVLRFCGASATKNEVVACLSEVMRNDTIRAQRHQIPKECRQQVKSQLYQQRESISLDPKLANVCKNELKQFCSDQNGPGQVNKNASHPSQAIINPLTQPNTYNDKLIQFFEYKLLRHIFYRPWSV